MSPDKKMSNLPYDQDSKESKENFFRIYNSIRNVKPRRKMVRDICFAAALTLVFLAVCSVFGYCYVEEKRMQHEEKMKLGYQSGMMY